jgi:hypothetical protein
MAGGIAHGRHTGGIAIAALVRVGCTTRTMVFRYHAGIPVMYPRSKSSSWISSTGMLVA